MMFPFITYVKLKKVSAAKKGKQSPTPHPQLSINDFLKSHLIITPATQAFLNALIYYLIKKKGVSRN